MVLTAKTGCKVAPGNSGGVMVKMKYEHNEVHDKTVGEIVRGGYVSCSQMNKEPECSECPFAEQNINCSYKDNQKRARVIEYIAEEVAKVWRDLGMNRYNCSLPKNLFIDRYPCDEKTIAEIKKSAWVLLESKDVEENTQEVKLCRFCKIPSVMESDVCYNCGNSFIDMRPEENYIADLLDGNRPTTADAFYVYNADLEKCVTVSKEQGDDIIDLTIHNEMDIATAKVFCEKLSSFLHAIGGEK